ncbi:SARG protein, partial [Anseranas semipalmata]|nr:SARG protein [Anseranas semipalmata]
MPGKDLGLGMAGCNSDSCDSMVSTASNHSQRSDNSYDYLSVEEKECLMFLEETIGSLDAEADSGVSTDETDYAEPPRLPRTWPNKDPAPQGLLHWSALPWQAGKEHCPSFIHMMSKSSLFSSLHSCCNAGAASSYQTRQTKLQGRASFLLHWLIRHEEVFYLENGAAPPSAGQQRAADQKGDESSSGFSGSAPAAASSPGYYSLPRNITVANAQRANQASGGKAAVHTMEDPEPPGKSSQEMAEEDRLGQGNMRTQVKPLIIPPPAPFQDDLGSQEEQPQRNSWDAKRENAEESWTRAVLPCPAPERAAVPDPVSLQHQEMGRESAALSQGQPEQPASQEAPQDPDAKRGPPTAPKPRKLPPNIILKTSKNSPVLLATEPGQKVKVPPLAPASSQPSSAGDAAAEKANSGQLDPKEREKARREALEKLGLPQDRGEPRARLSPAPAPHSKDRAVESAVPAARAMNFKSNTLERSGVGLGSCMASAKEPGVKGSGSLGKMSFIERLAPSFLRSSRPRPASLGAGKDFAALKEPADPEKSSKRRSHPLQSFPRPPRSCVSVKISPKGATDEHRREALRKLGLLKE